MTYRNPHVACLIITALAVLAVSARQCHSRSKAQLAITPAFDRAQLMLINLNRGKVSSGYYLQESGHKSRLMLHDLDKCLHQVEQVSKTYARSRGKPDNEYLTETVARIKEARATAATLGQQLQEAEDELKSSIQQTLLSD